MPDGPRMAVLELVARDVDLCGGHGGLSLRPGPPGMFMNMKIKGRTLYRTTFSSRGDAVSVAGLCSCFCSIPTLAS